MTHYVENIHYSGRYRGEKPVIKNQARMTGISDLSHYLAGSDSLTDLARRAAFFISDLVKVKTCRIYLASRDGNWFQPTGDDGHVFFPHIGSEGTQEAKVLNQLFDSVIVSGITPEKWKRSLTVEEYAALGVSQGTSAWLIPLIVEKEAVGVLFLCHPIDPSANPLTADITYELDLVADQLGNAIHRNQLNERLSNLSIETVLALSRTLDARDSHSGSHGKRMAGLSEQMALKFRLSVRETRELCWAALLHDIGKIGVEDQILYKAGPLTEREWEIMKTHPEIGAQMIRGLSGMENIAALILSHHERLDGSGYPRGLHGEQIPLGARIIAVVDSYAAMTEGRPYRRAKTHKEAIAELQDLAGTQYDAEVVHTFVSLFEEKPLNLHTDSSLTG
jgi:putative nucleotidyltransferase with HDIG domain